MRKIKTLLTDYTLALLGLYIRMVLAIVLILPFFLPFDYIQDKARWAFDEVSEGFSEGLEESQVAIEEQIEKVSPYVERDEDGRWL